MFNILLIFTVALAASYGDPVANSPRSFTSTYTLYTNDSPRDGQRILLTTASVNALRITAATNCAIIVHGAGGRGSDSMSLVLRDAFLTSGPTNVVIVDWYQAASSQWASEAVEDIANNVIELVRLMTVQNKISRARLHLVGFDLGAHLVGYVGRAYSANVPVARITGLNPRGDDWAWSSNRLRNSDASYVEVIHTETAKFGLTTTIGDVDFYPHGGKTQPGCKNDNTDIENLCSHNRAWELFAASLTHGRINGYRCNNVNEAIGTEPCTGFTLTLGTNDLVKYGAGTFRIETNAVYPYRCLVKCGLLDSIIEAIAKLSDGDGIDDGEGSGYGDDNW